MPLANYHRLMTIQYAHGFVLGPRGPSANIFIMAEYGRGVCVRAPASPCTLARDKRSRSCTHLLFKRVIRMRNERKSILIHIVVGILLVFAWQNVMCRPMLPDFYPSSLTRGVFRLCVFARSTVSHFLHIYIMRPS